jgi:uncharacterized protein (UPF0332 family)
LPHNNLIEKAITKLESAEYLFDGGYFEDAASRAYYAMYYGARALLALRDIYPKTHGGLISKFGLQYVKEGYLDVIHGRAIAQAKDIRESADYGVGIEISEEEAKDVIENAKSFLDKVQNVIEEINSDKK